MSLLKQFRLMVPSRATRHALWRAMPITGPLFHLSADGKPHLNSIEFALRMGRI